MAIQSWIPYILFVVLEPVGLFTGWLSILQDPQTYLQSNNPFIPLPPQNPHAESAILQLGNLYFFCACVQLTCCAVSRDPLVTRLYLAAAAVFDLGHVYGVYRGLGWERFADWQGWNGAIWGNVVFTMVLCVVRVAFVVGVFGEGKGKGEGKEKAGRKDL